MLSGVAATWPLATFAQQPAMPVIGLLSGVPFETRRAQLAAFHRGLREAGYVEGQNVAIEYRSADNQSSRLPTLAADLVERGVSVIVTIGGDATARAAKSATTAIPVVFVSGNDAAKIGLVASLNRPGGNVTGISFLAILALPKQLELLSQVAPAAEMMGLLVNPNNPNAEDSTREAHIAAATLGKTLLSSMPTLTKPSTLPSQHSLEARSGRSWSPPIQLFLQGESISLLWPRCTGLLRSIHLVSSLR